MTIKMNVFPLLKVSMNLVNSGMLVDEIYLMFLTFIRFFTLIFRYIHGSMRHKPSIFSNNLVGKNYNKC